VAAVPLASGASDSEAGKPDVPYGLTSGDAKDCTYNIFHFRWSAELYTEGIQRLAVLTLFQCLGNQDRGRGPCETSA
jgi:hypothetical protein